MRATRPAAIEIVRSSPGPREEHLTVRGKVGNAVSSGSVVMILESGGWKVKKENWESEVKDRQIK